MVKQTVEQKYIIEQALQHAEAPKNVVNSALKTIDQKKVLSVMMNMEKALQRAHQAIRQVQESHSSIEQIQVANKNISMAVQLLQQLKISAPEMVFGLSSGEQQQLKQLDYQIEQSKGTLEILQQSLTNK